MIFSSWRDRGHYPTGGPIAQLYMTAVTADEINVQTNYPAVYLWNQPATSSNHTPAWDRFQIPDVMCGRRTDPVVAGGGPRAISPGHVHRRPLRARGPGGH